MISSSSYTVNDTLVLRDMTGEFFVDYLQITAEAKNLIFNTLS